MKTEIEKELHRFDNSLSPFNPNSIISKINHNESVETDSLFQNCFNLSMRISKETDGAFDITVAPLVNAWGFGFKKNSFPDSAKIDSLKQFIGYQKVKLENGRIVKQDPRLMLDCSAVAKGYAVDIVAQFLEKKGVENFMVDIGGEVVVKGVNPKNRSWRIGINKPIDDSLSVNQELQTILELSNVGLATSGNYRNFYYKGGKKYAHTIDPKSGYPIQHNILSSTVVAQNCMTADALATSFMVMGLEKAKSYCRTHEEVEAYFIYSDQKGKLNIYFTDGMKKYIAQ